MSKGKKRFFILLLLVSLALIVMNYQRDRKPLTFFDALSYPYYALSRALTSAEDAVTSVQGLSEENKKLKKEVLQFRIERQQYRELAEESKRLRELLSLKEREPRYVATARVISNGYDRLLNIAVLDKGQKDGIEKGLAVITVKGLAGKVHTVKDNFCEVLLMKDTNFSAAVRLQNSRHEGVISGTGYGYGILKYIPPEETVIKGEVVVTSGLDGIFPPGLPVGVVSKVIKKATEFFQYIEVAPFQPAEKLEEVVILK